MTRHKSTRNKPSKPRKAPGIARHGLDERDGMPMVVCKCGWSKRHERERVREDALDKHFAEKHHGRGFRL